MAGVDCYPRTKTRSAFSKTALAGDLFQELANIFVDSVLSAVCMPAVTRMVAQGCQYPVNRLYLAALDMREGEYR